MNCKRCGRAMTKGSEVCPFCAMGTQTGADGLEKLVADARAGKQEAQAALYEKTYSAVYYTIKSMIRDENTVLDLLQDTYLKAYTHLDSFAGDAKFGAWIRQIAANTTRDYLRKKKPMLFAELAGNEEPDEAVEERFEDLDAGNLPDVVLDRAESVRLIRDIIDGLPEDQRAVIGMYYYQERSVKEISEALGASESAVKSRLLYGRRKVEAKVRDLEKKGTKLYGLAPMPFLLWLMGTQEAQAGALPDDRILQKVLEQAGTAAGANAGTASTAGTGAAASGRAAAAGGVKAAFGGLGAVKLTLATVAVLAVVGVGVYGLSQRSGPTGGAEVPAPPPVSSSTELESDSGSVEEPDLDLVEQAMEAYREILAQVDRYSYALYSVQPTGNYRYALVQLETDDPVPTLLVAQEEEDQSSWVRLFQYDPENQVVVTPEDVLQESRGSGSIGYTTNVSFSLQGDGTGLRLGVLDGRSNSVSIIRVTLQGERLQEEVQWSGPLVSVPHELSSRDILWHALSDQSMLETQLPEADPLQQPGTDAEPNAAQGSEGSPAVGGTDEEKTLPTDGARIVFTGTLDTYSYEEVVALQGCADPNAAWTDPNQTYRLLVLDTPQTMELMGIDGPRSGEVTMVSVRFAQGLESYDGQHVIVSIDPEKTYWPSDTSLPLGQPSTKDVHILG